MSINNIKEAIPEFAKDLKLNLSNLMMDETLTMQQKAGCFLGCAIAGRNEFVIKNIFEQISEHFDDKTINAMKSAAAIMGMNNIYYRFSHLVSNPDYQAMPARLRMNVIGNPGVDKIDFELWSLAVSVVNGCGMCIDSHEKILKDNGISKEQIQTAARIASVVYAVSCILNDEGKAL